MGFFSGMDNWHMEQHFAVCVAHTLHHLRMSAQLKKAVEKWLMGFSLCNIIFSILFWQIFHSLILRQILYAQLPIPGLKNHKCYLMHVAEEVKLNIKSWSWKKIKRINLKSIQNKVRILKFKSIFLEQNLIFFVAYCQIFDERLKEYKFDNDSEGGSNPKKLKSIFHKKFYAILFCIITTSFEENLKFIFKKKL